jgi:hypothetical protein
VDLKQIITDHESRFVEKQLFYELSRSFQEKMVSKDSTVSDSIGQVFTQELAKMDHLIEKQ